MTTLWPFRLCFCYIGISHLYQQHRTYTCMHAEYQNVRTDPKIPNRWHTDIWCARINVLSAIINIWWMTWWMDSNKNKNNNNDEKSTKYRTVYIYLMPLKQWQKKSAWRRADNSKTLITTIINDHIVQYPHYAADQPLSITWNKRRKRPLYVWWAYVCCVLYTIHEHIHLCVCFVCLNLRTRKKNNLLVSVSILIPSELYYAYAFA